MTRSLIVKVVVAVAIAIAVPGVTPLRATEVGPGYDIEMSRTIPMRDGVELEA